MASEGVLATLHQGWDALTSLNSPMALIGGLALTAWNHARYTRDADAAMLLRVNREEIDFQRLSKAVRSLELTADYDAIWRDAFPDERMPHTQV